MIKLFNTLTRQKDELKPLSKKQIGLYTCGPTVYNYAHIGNLRTYVFEDILKRVLKYNGYRVNHIMNITDVGHLTSDADFGEDKMEKGAKREGKTAWEIAEFYTKKFKENLQDLNIEPPTKWCPATQYIKEQIALVQKLIDKNVTYTTSDGIYFDTTKIKNYGELAGLQKQKLQAGARVDIGEKKNPHDFAIWKFTAPGEKRQMEWEAFEHQGFPGWHLECSAIALTELGEQFDIHCGGVDHIPVHHTNEIAQSETATGKQPWVNYWLHGDFLNLSETKMAKSGNNFITLDALKKDNLNPLAYRFLLLQTHYRKILNFNKEALKAAQTGLDNLYKEAKKLKKEGAEGRQFDQELEERIKKSFLEEINDDLFVAGALAATWDRIESRKISYQTLLQFDKIFGLEIEAGVKSLEEAEKNKKEEILPPNVEILKLAREQFRQEKNWAKSDELRKQLEDLGYTVEDTPQGQNLTKL
ncbi:MAG TPA: cysteine--tRNA ligase [Candidatus Magasanikbacteria bacterium]|nr:cysteine--tRNA ligase [Candidatus Magasanikbacteria bacterium]